MVKGLGIVLSTFYVLGLKRAETTPCVSIMLTQVNDAERRLRAAG